MSQEQPMRDEFSEIKPERVWLSLSNVCDQGKFKVTLEVNGQPKELFNSYVHQNDGIVLHDYNLTWLFNSRNEEINRLHCFRNKDQELMEGAFDTISELKNKIDILKVLLKDALPFITQSKLLMIGGHERNKRQYIIELEDKINNVLGVKNG
jgi:hypothetical protein